MKDGQTVGHNMYNVMHICASRKSLQARLKRPSFRSEKDKRDKESKSNSSSLGSLREGDLIMNSKVVNFTTDILYLEFLSGLDRPLIVCAYMCKEYEKVCKKPPYTKSY